MERVRAFVAIGLGEELKRELVAIQRRLGEAAIKRQIRWLVRWVAPQNIHLTLKFLGEVDAARIPELTTALHGATENIESFTLTVRDLGCFPSAKRPNVIWAGLNGQLPSLVEFARRVEDAFGALGFPREARPFSPHLTLGRIKREARPPERAAIGETVEQFAAKELGIIAARAVHLIRSDLKPDGPIYSTLSTVKLHDPLPRPP
jgi:2'-5' RNA ligase